MTKQPAQPQQQQAAQSGDRSSSAPSSTVPSGPSSQSGASGQEHLWSSLKLDPLLIAHASGLHRVRQDVATLKEHFSTFANHLLLMSKSGAVLTAHLSSLYKASTIPPAIALMQSSHAAMHASSLSWFSSRFHNELLTQIDDWLEDCEEVLTQLGLVQKTRHELDGLQDEVEKVFSRKLEAPHWDASAESSLKRRLENAKEKLASACSLYDGQRRGVEKSMRFLLDQRALLFHQVVTCFAESEYRFFRDFAAHAAGFVHSYPFAPMPPTCQFSEEPFAKSHLQQPTDDWQHSASALLLTLPYFAWTDPSHADESAEGPSVRAIRRSMAKHLQRKQQAAGGSSQGSASTSRRGSIDAAAGPNAAAAGGWEAQAEAWEARQSADAATSGPKATSPEVAAQNLERELSSPLHTFQEQPRPNASFPPAVTAAPAPVAPKVSALVSPASSATSADSDEDAVEDLTMADLKQGADGAEEAEEGEDEEEEEDEEAAAAAEAARQERKRQKKERKEAKRARKEAKKLRRMQEAQEEPTDSDADQEEVDEEPVSQPPPASAAAAAAAAASVSPVALRTSIDPLSPTSSEYGVHIEPVSSKPKKKSAASAPAAAAAPAADDPSLSVRVSGSSGVSPSLPTPSLGRSASAMSARSDMTSEASEAGSPDVFESPRPLTEPTPTPQSQMPPSTAVDSYTPRTFVNLQAAVEAQAGAAAALNLPAKMLTNPPPSATLHPALWEPVSLPRIKGSIWGRILVEHLEFDEETDELREKYSILPAHLPVFEQAFKADHPLNIYVASTQMERERQRQQEALQSSQAAQAKAVQLAQHQTASTPSRRVAAASQPPSDRFAHMRQLDGTAFVSSSAGLSDASFPAPPFPSFSAKSWYVSHQILSRVLFPFTPSEVVEALYKLDDKVLTPERVAGLMRIMPSQEQRGSILRAAAERQARLPAGTSLTPIEQLFVYLSLNVSPSLSSRLHVLSFQVEFGPLCYNLERTLDVVESCCAELRKSANLRILFAVVLHFGNRLNHSHNILPAYGFQLDFLSSLRRIRMASRGGPNGSANNSSLLDFLVWYLSSNYPALSFQSFSASSFPHLARALAVDEYLFSMEMRHVNEGYAELKGMADEDQFEKQNRSVSSTGSGSTGAPSSSSSISSGKSASSPTGSSGFTLPFPVSSFPPRGPRFLSYVQSRLTVLRHKHAKVRADLAETMRYLCVEPLALRDPNLDAAVASMPLHLAEMALPPLGEVPASAAGAAASTAPDGTPLHLRFQWQKALRTLHRFLQEFSLALQDHLVAAKVARQAKIA